MAPDGRATGPVIDAIAMFIFDALRLKASPRCREHIKCCFITLFIVLRLFRMGSQQGDGVQARSGYADLVVWRVVPVIPVQNKYGIYGP